MRQNGISDGGQHPLCVHQSFLSPQRGCWPPSKTAFRMGANTLSAEIERTDGRIVLSRRLTLASSVLVCSKYCPQIRAKATKKSLNFYQDRSAALELHG